MSVNMKLVDGGTTIKKEPISDSQFAEADSSTNSTAHSNSTAETTTRQSSLQRIQMRKEKVSIQSHQFPQHTENVILISIVHEKVYKLPKQQKMAKLAMYSACQSTDCRCTGWKTPEENRHKDVESNYCPKFSDECRNVNCKHSLDDHISHLGYITDEQINELLGAIVDVENLFMSMHREQDEDTKKVYYYLFRVSLCDSDCVCIHLNRVFHLVSDRFFSCCANAFWRDSRPSSVGRWAIHHSNCHPLRKPLQISFSSSINTYRSLNFRLWPKWPKHSCIAWTIGISSRRARDVSNWPTRMHRHTKSTIRDGWCSVMCQHSVTRCDTLKRPWCSVAPCWRLSTNLFANNCCPNAKRKRIECQ